ncbi:hypothetical protein V6U71_19720 [Sphingopyxis sp. J-6]
MNPDTECVAGAVPNDNFRAIFLYTIVIGEIYFLLTYVSPVIAGHNPIL